MHRSSASPRWGRRLAAVLAALVLSGAAGAAAAAAAAAPSPGRLPAGPQVAPEVVLVHGATAASAAGAARQAGLGVVDRWHRVGVAVAVGTPAGIDRLSADPRVHRVERDRPISFDLETAHLATGAEDARDPANGVTHPSGVPFDGAGVSIAVVDSGVDGTHPFFARPDGTSAVVRNLRQVCDGSAVCDAWVDVPDSDTVGVGGHGTHVAGIAGGVAGTTLGGDLIRGAAPGSSLVALGAGAFRSIIAADAALHWVLEHHADPCGDGSCPPIRVVNNSWGSDPGPHDPGEATSKLVQALVDDGVVVVFAAGNDGGDGSANRLNPEAQHPAPGVIAVANYSDDEAGRRDHRLSASSSRGLRGSPETYPDVAAPGSSIRSSCRAWLVVCTGVDAEPDYNRLSGTSMAAPYVAGVVALLLQADPTLTPAEVERIVEVGARSFGDPSVYEPDPANADSLVSFDAGHGLVDVVASLELVLSAG